eukprot:g943.t1
MEEKKVNPPFRIIGLTGGIASGKSTVSKILTKLGATVVDADRLGHDCYKVGTSCYDEVVSTFGEKILLKDGSGTIDRGTLGGIVFSDKAEMKKLTDICWPFIRKKLEQSIAAARTAYETETEAESEIRNKNIASSVFVFEAAVLVEAKWFDLADEVWVVYVSKGIAMKRIMHRNNLSAKEARKRIAAQISNDERFQFANLRIPNFSDQNALERQITEEYIRLTTNDKRHAQHLSPSLTSAVHVDAGKTTKGDVVAPVVPPKFDSMEAELQWWKEEQKRLVERQTLSRTARWEETDRIELEKKKLRAKQLDNSNENEFLLDCPEIHGLNQYWYSTNTINVFVEEAKTYGTSVCCLSTPSIYFSLPQELQNKGKVFDFDEQWKSHSGFVKYDFNHPTVFPSELQHSFDFIIIDPPFITEEVWRKYAETAKLLLKKEGKLLCTTIDENKELLFELLGVKPCIFRPSIPNLVYQYSVYANYSSKTLAIQNSDLSANL